jgi:hypothetical protein
MITTVYTSSTPQVNKLEILPWGGREFHGVTCRQTVKIQEEISLATAKKR